MAYEQKNQEGSIFKNADKTEPGHADYNGSALIESKQYWVNAWINTAKNGNKYLKLKFKPKDFAQREKPQSITERAQAAMKRPRGASDDEMSDEIPF